MRNDKLIPGTILVIIGILFLLDNFGTIDFDWFSLIRLWPILLVIAGVNLVFAHNQTHLATALKIVVLIGGMAFLIVNGLNHHGERRGWRGIFNHNDYIDSVFDKDDIHVGDKNTAHFQEAYKPVIQNTVLNISSGATSYIIQDTTNNLFEADTRTHSGNFNLNTSIDSATETLDFGQDRGENGHHGFIFNFGNNNSNRAYLKLNSKPTWEINVEAGVAKVNFDLSPFKVQKLKIEGGVASFYVKMGQPLAETHIEVSTGVSRLTLDIPKNSACHITTDTGVSSKRLDGFQNVGDNEYETPGFDKATNKMYINLSGGLSKFRVNQY